jgi:hypothetical protein
MMWDISFHTINNDEQNVACQVIEFWSAIADVEIMRIYNLTHVSNMAVGRYTKIAAPMLTPLLLANLHE